jgi:hypothetical protein
MSDEAKQFLLYVAGYLYSLTDDHEGMGREWHIQRFLSIYNEYKDTEHDGDCTQKPWSCWRCFIESYLEEASNIIKRQALEDHLKGLEE